MNVYIQINQMILKTIKVKTDSNEFGYYFINESDYDPDTHQLFEELPAKKKPAEKPVV